MSRHTGLTAIKAAAAALAIAAVTVLAPGCQPECVDKFDCINKAPADAGAQTCVAGACKPGSPDPGDAGQ